MNLWLLARVYNVSGVEHGYAICAAKVQFAPFASVGCAFAEFIVLQSVCGIVVH